MHNTNHFYFLLAHLHTAMIYEPKGKLEIYRSPTISGYSRWSNGKGFVSNERRTLAFILDKENAYIVHVHESLTEREDLFPFFSVFINPVNGDN